jgi:hypothetical protein
LQKTSGNSQEVGLPPEIGDPISPAFIDQPTADERGGEAGQD